MKLDENNMRGQLGVDPAQKFPGGEDLLPRLLVSGRLVK